MIEQPEAQGPGAGKLVLPAYDRAEYDMAVPGNAASSDMTYASVPHTPPQVRMQTMYPPPPLSQPLMPPAPVSQPLIRPDQLIRRDTRPAPKEPLAKLRYYWHKDPAYKVLLIAVGVVLIAGLIFISVVGNMVANSQKLLTPDTSFSQNGPTVVVPAGTVDLRPTFSAPGGGNGSTASSQPPAQTTPALQPTPNDTPTVQPSPNPGGSFTVQITSIPGRVQNNSMVLVGINTSQPNIDVYLVVYYTVPPFRYVAGPRQTDSNGNALISWAVSLNFNVRHTQATVIAIARDQNGQRVQSQPVSVQIMGG